MIEMLQRMLVIREFDSRLPALYTQGLIRGSSHAAIGQEAVAVGVCSALEPADYITSTHRGHGHTIAKGGDVRRMMAELLGRETGYCRGKGGSMHIADFSIGMLGANGIVGGGFGLAAGAALSASMRQSSQVVVCFFGDGAINQGAFHEVANMAAIWKLPLLLVCENNQFAMSARVSQMVSIGDLTGRSEGYGIPARAVDGMDVLAVHSATRQAADFARAGRGPFLLVATCYRFMGHFSGDLQKYRTKEEADSWLNRDPITRFRDQLIQIGVLTDADAERMVHYAKTLIEEALTFAQESLLPDPGSAWEDLYA